MTSIIGYMAHDPILNNEEPLTNYDEAVLAEMEDSGIVFIAVHDDDTRTLVKASDITPPEPQMGGVTLVTPIYVDTRTEATVAVFDALAAIVDPESAVATADETGEITEATDPVQAFKDALAALKALEPQEEADSEQ